MPTLGAGCVPSPVRGRVEPVDLLDEILGLIGDVPGVDEVIDEVWRSPASDGT